MLFLALLWPHWSTLVAVGIGVLGWIFWRRIAWGGSLKDRPLAPDERGCLIGLSMFVITPLLLLGTVLLIIGWGHTTWPWNTAAILAMVLLASQMVGDAP